MSKRVNKFILAACLAGIAPAALAVDDYGMTQSQQAPPKAAAAAPESYGTAVSNKLGSGFSNLALGFLEIPKNVVNTTNDVNLAWGITGGMAKGILHTAGRMLAGTVDLLTFPAPTQPLTTPQYVWSQFTVETRYNPLFKSKE